MPALDLTSIGELLAPFYPHPSQHLLGQLSVYLELLLKWNGRTNLTSIRTPEDIVRRHFGESLFVAGHLPQCSTLLDLGSGAGFPGLPIQLVSPKLRVTLAESQNKKVSFLREVIRTLELDTEVWHGRIEAMPADRRFDVVTLRAVDSPQAALELAHARLAIGGTVAHLTTSLSGASALPVPGSSSGYLELSRPS